MSWHHTRSWQNVIFVFFFLATPWQLYTVQQTLVQSKATKDKTFLPMKRWNSWYNCDFLILMASRHAPQKRRSLNSLLTYIIVWWCADTYKLWSRKTRHLQRKDMIVSWRIHSCVWFFCNVGMESRFTPMDFQQQRKMAQPFRLVSKFFPTHRLYFWMCKRKLRPSGYIHRNQQ